jgi:hypothetical protein
VDEYLEAGVTILSIMDDTTHIASTSGQINPITYRAPNHTITNLKPTHLSQNMLMFTGMRYATLEEVYMSIGVIASYEKLELGSSSIVNDTNLSGAYELPVKKTSIKGSIDLEATAIAKLDY